MKLRFGLVIVGTAALIVAILLGCGAAAAAAAQSWPPFVLVAGLLAIGLVANADGLFEWAAGLLDRLPGGEIVLYVTSMLLVAVVTVLLNLDTSVAFLTPVLIHVARRRNASRMRLLYGCVFMSNSASLLLPGSNLTNLLVLSRDHVSGAIFAGRMLPAWLASVAVTTAVVGVLLRDGDHGEARKPPATPPRPGWLGSAATVVALILVLVLAEPALPVLALGTSAVSVAMVRGRIAPRQAWDLIDPISLAAIFAVAVGMGTLARRWLLPGQVMGRSGVVTTALLAAALTVLVNNLPAAVLLSTPIPPHPRSLLLGLDLGPNLAMTGSLSALIWYRAARSVGETPSPLRYSLVGLAVVPLTLAAALGAQALAGMPGF